LVLSGGSYSLRERPDGRTEVAVTTRYTQGRRPAWFWRPVEAAVCHLFHRHLLAAVRRKVGVPIAADESIRRADDPFRVVELEAADIAVLKVAPLGGFHACLRIAEQIGLPVVVSSAVETSIGLAAGLALAAALPELPYACGLATLQLLAGDVTSAPLRVVDGELPVVRPEPDASSTVAADPGTTDRWLSRLRAVEARLGSRP